MDQKWLGAITITVLLLVSLSCQAVSSQTVSTVTTAASVEEQAAVIESPAPAQDFPAETQAAQESTMASAAAQTEAAVKQTETAAAQAEATIEAVSAESTRAAEKMIAQTAEVETLATAQAQDLANVVSRLYEEGILEKSSGTYYRMDDFEESWAQIGWYQWWETGLAPVDFVIRAHTGWESASKTPNWFDSGCGFVFREVDENNHYMIFLALDGNVYLKGYLDGIYREFGKGYAGTIDHLKGDADVMLVVEGPRITYYVNGKKVLAREVGELDEGKLALTLVSGTNKDYGTRCTISDIEIWDLTSQ
jgi:hypothetical protein